MRPEFSPVWYFVDEVALDTAAQLAVGLVPMQLWRRDYGAADVAEIEAALALLKGVGSEDGEISQQVAAERLARKGHFHWPAATGRPPHRADGDVLNGLDAWEPAAVVVAALLQRHLSEFQDGCGQDRELHRAAAFLGGAVRRTKNKVRVQGDWRGKGDSMRAGPVLCVADVARLLAEAPAQSATRDSFFSEAELRALQNEDDPCHPPELVAAIEAWREMRRLMVAGAASHQTARWKALADFGYTGEGKLVPGATRTMAERMLAILTVGGSEARKFERKLIPEARKAREEARKRRAREDAAKAGGRGGR